MNLYFLVEGPTEKKVYREWLSAVFPDLCKVDRPEDLIHNNMRLIAGIGYPQVLRRIDEVLEEIAGIAPRRIDHLFVCIDAEERSFEECHDEIADRIEQGPSPPPYSVIVQQCCLETWLLGHSRFLKRNPYSEKLRVFKAFYDVSVQNPEKMGTLPPYRQRAPFHLDYLKEMFHERGLRYTNKSPGEAATLAYFRALIERHRSTDHLSSFGRLVSVWRMLGAEI